METSSLDQIYMTKFWLEHDQKILHRWTLRLEHDWKIHNDERYHWTWLSSVSS